MGGSILQIALYVLAGTVFGVVMGWLLHSAISKRRIGELINESRTKLDDLTRQRDQLASKYSKSRSAIRSLQAAVAKGRTEHESAVEKAKLLAKNVLTLRTERENTKFKVSTIQNALMSLRQHTEALQTEFKKVGEFYKGELVKSFEKRKVLEEQVEKARLERESFASLVESSISEHGSSEEMIAAAQIRLGQLEVLERNVNKLEAENAQLCDDVKRIKQKYEAQERELAKLDELRMHNKQLVRCVESLESSRAQHEQEAEQYRGQADESEQLSETLRLKLDDLEKNFADIEKQQHQAIKDVRKAAVVPISGASKALK